MGATRDYIDQIKGAAKYIQQEFAVESLSVFGSVARGQHHEGSDVDVFVSMPARMVLVVGLQQYLEELLGCSVDVVRNHKGLNPYLKKQIENDGITIIRAA